MTNKELLMKFKDEFPFAKVNDFRPICHELFTDGRQGITIWLEDGSIVEYYPNMKGGNEQMTKEEARIKLITKREELMHKYMFEEAEMLTMAIEALKDRPRGEWKKATESIWKCSLCNAIMFTDSNYCPNCGAKMDRERSEK